MSTDREYEEMISNVCVGILIALIVGVAAWTAWTIYDYHQQRKEDAQHGQL